MAGCKDGLEESRIQQVDPDILKINDEYNNLAKELRKKLGLPAAALKAAQVVKEDEKK